ncbi:O-methyltransferase [Nocardia sp. BMG111209]|uniref:O-methyltransferase n=1 Tax=Nocardia sp. BMG111209 TaxID=1160137 RepID=UPI0003A69E64|nr:O-methyltransferase [Nocardia sp. BMG111209]
MTTSEAPQPYSDKTLTVTPELTAYVRAQAGPPTAVQRRLIEETTALGGPAEMQIPPEQGVLLTLLARLLDARTVIEVGTFTGYSTLALAEGVGPDGSVITCDISDRWSAIADRAWRDAGVDDRIRRLIGPAAVTLGALPDEPFADLVFIDADKVGYIGYWEMLVPRVRPGGLLIADNVLYAGAAVSPDATGNAAAIRQFNDHVRADPRVESVLLPVADGITLARKHSAKESE